MSTKKKHWTISEALEAAKKININLSRPTVIKMCRTYGVGYQPTGCGGNWVVVSDRFTSMIKGSKYDWTM